MDEVVLLRVEVKMGETELVEIELVEIVLL